MAIKFRKSYFPFGINQLLTNNFLCLNNVYTTPKCFECLTNVKKVLILLKSKLLYTNSLPDW